LEKLEQAVKSAEAYLWDVHTRNYERKKLEDEQARLTAELAGTDEAADTTLLAEAEASYLAAEVLAKATDLAVCQEKIRSLKQEPTAKAADIANARKALAHLDELDAHCAQLSAKCAGLKASAAAQEKLIADLQGRAALFERSSALASSLELVKRVLHPDSLPKVVMRRRIEGLNVCMEKYLRMFEAPFGLRLDPDTMDFRCSFPGKDDAPAGAMSGGQKVVASLVFRFAFVELVGFGCGLWVLDEPTEFMDSRNRQMLMDFLQRAAGHFRSRDLTLLIPTHDEGLLSVCDSTINLGKEQHD
jgi:DNA repair exonuclease SbcCD ATPase subunit